MPERYERALRIICLVLGGVLLLRIGWVAIHHNPVAHLKIPTVPTLASADPASTGKNASGLSNTNGAKESANTSTKSRSDNSTNSVANRPATATTNVASGAAPRSTNQDTVGVAKIATNSSPNPKTGASTNILVGQTPQNPSTNSVPTDKSTTNGLATPTPVAKAGAAGSLPHAPNAPLNPPQPPGMPGKPRELPAEIQARVDRVTDSEILGPVMRPLPMALLGIAGNVAFLRAPTGQTGLVKEGDNLGGLKLLRIGINRVLVEQEGQKKELIMFSGFGGESLLPK
jgi:hypothetical protein